MSVVTLSPNDPFELRKVTPPHLPPIEFSLREASLQPTLSTLGVQGEKPREARAPIAIPSPMYRLFALQLDIEESVAEEAALNRQEIAWRTSQCTRLEKEAFKALEEEAEWGRARDAWEPFIRVCNYVLSATSLISAFECGIDTTPGALLLASAVFGLSGQVLQDTGAIKYITSLFYEEAELQKKLADQMLAGMAIVSLGLGLAGGFAAHRAGLFDAARQAGQEAWMEKIGRVVGTAAGLAGASLRMGQAWADKKMYDKRADRQDLSLASTEHHHEIDERTKESSHSVDVMQSVNGSMQQMARDYGDALSAAEA